MTPQNIRQVIVGAQCIMGQGQLVYKQHEGATSARQKKKNRCKSPQVYHVCLRDFDTRNKMVVARGVDRVEKSRQLREGGGFLVRRPIGDRIDQCDPFLMLDHLGPVVYGPGEAVGAPDHPHRGFETVSYLIDGKPYTDTFLRPNCRVTGACKFDCVINVATWQPKFTGIVFHYLNSSFKIFLKKNIQRKCSFRS